MKNKIVYLILALIMNFSLAKPLYSQFEENDRDCSEIITETSASICDTIITDNFRYVSLGVGPIVFVPNICIGYRERCSQYGWDSSLSFSTIGYVHQLSGHLVRHYYFTPACKNSAYVGLGLMGSGVISNCGDGGGTLSPDFVLGNGFGGCGDRRQFFEMHVAIPTLWINRKHIHGFYLPLMYIKYGISF